MEILKSLYKKYMGMGIFLKILWAILILRIIILILNLIIYPGKPFVRPHIHAEAYVWPVGCQPGRYTKDDGGGVIPIPPFCADEKYRFGDDLAYNYGLYRSSRNDHYYRIDNDLASIRCHAGIIDKEKSCNIVFVIKNSYYQ